MIGPKMKMSIAGKMSVPIGMSIFTGALATFSSSLVLRVARISMPALFKVSAIEVPKRSERMMLSMTRSKRGES